MTRFHLRREGQRRAPSIQGVANTWGIILGGLVVVLAAVLIWSSVVLQHSTAEVERRTQRAAAVSRLELLVFTYQRISNIRLVHSDSGVRGTREDIVARMHALLDEAAEHAENREEALQVEQVRGALDAYLAEHRRIQSQGVPVQQVLRRTQSRLDETIAALDALREYTRARVRDALDEAGARSWIDEAVGIGAGLVFTLVLLTLIVGVRKYLVRPVLDMHDAITRFREGDFDARVPDAALRELSDVSSELNEMASERARQREIQLTFLAGVAHDLRNPLSAIRMGAHALERHPDEAGRVRVRERIDRQVDRLARMVDDLLDATRIEAGKLELRLEDFDVRQVVTEMVELYTPTSPDHQICANLPDEAVIVRGDPLRIEQVISNLLSNAVKFSPDGGRVEVSIRCSGENAELRVADRGIGIRDDQLSEIFVPFRRPSKGVAPGAGLGLSVVKKIVTAHGGTIDVDSEPGVGSTFCVTVPLAEARRRQAAREPEQEPAPPAS